MTNAIANPDLLARDLARLLGDLAGLYVQMAEHMRQKLVVMRQADSEQIAAITAQELPLAEKVQQREGLRRQITRRIAEAFGLGRAQADAMRVNDLADLLPEPRRSQLLTAAAGLRQRVAELQLLTQTNVLVTNAMLKHLSEVVTVMCRGGPAAEDYTRGGRRAQQHAASVFEAVG